MLSDASVYRNGAVISVTVEELHGDFFNLTSEINILYTENKISI